MRCVANIHSVRRILGQIAFIVICQPEPWRGEKACILYYRVYLVFLRLEEEDTDS